MHFREQKSAKEPKGWCAILRARPRGCIKERIRMLDRRNFMKTCSGMGLDRTLSTGGLSPPSQAQGAAKSTETMIDNAASVADAGLWHGDKVMPHENLNEHAKGYEEIYKL